MKSKNGLLIIGAIALLGIAIMRKKKPLVDSAGADSGTKKSSVPNLGGGAATSIIPSIAVPGTQVNVNTQVPSSSVPTITPAQVVSGETAATNTGAVRTDNTTPGGSSSTNSTMVSSNVDVGASTSNSSAARPNNTTSGSSKAQSLRFMDFMSADSDIDNIQDSLL